MAQQEVINVNQHPHHDTNRVSSEDAFTNVFTIPAQRWYKEMRWTKGKPRVSKQRRWEAILSYAPDWIITILLTALLVIFINRVYGFRREFSLTDTSIQYTLKENTISVGVLAVISFVIPVVIFAGLSLGLFQSFWDFHAGLLGLVLAHAITLVATTTIKVIAGRPRPDLIDRCQPRPGSMNGVPYGLVTQAICSSDLSSKLMKEGFRSFPSGHASTAFAGLTFFSFWLAGKLHLFHPGHGHAALHWIVFVPMLGAVLICVSRTMDYRHHATDVIAGGILGFIVAVVCYHIYYPPLNYATSHKPWPPRNSQPSMHPDYEEDDDIERTPLGNTARPSSSSI